MPMYPTEKLKDVIGTGEIIREYTVVDDGYSFQDPENPEHCPHEVDPDLEAAFMSDVPTEARRDTMIETNEKPWKDNLDWADQCDELRKGVVFKALQMAESSVASGEPTEARMYLALVQDATNTDAFNELLAAASR